MEIGKESARFKISQRLADQAGVDSKETLVVRPYATRNIWTVKS